MVVLGGGAGTYEIPQTLLRHDPQKLAREITLTLDKVNGR